MIPDMTPEKCDTLTRWCVELFSVTKSKAVDTEEEPNPGLNMLSNFYSASNKEIEHEG